MRNNSFLLKYMLEQEPHMSSAAANRMKERVDQFYIPIYNWMTEQMRQSSNRNTFLIGIQCVQGGGKTTLTNALEKLFEFDNTTCAVLSLDDVYYTHSQQLALAEKFPNDPLLQVRIFRSFLIDR